MNEPISCGICCNLYPNHDDLIILPCHGFHVVCSVCVQNNFKSEIESNEKDDCWLFGKNCDSNNHHFRCSQCESPFNVFHIPENDINNLVRLIEYSHLVSFDGLPQVAELKIVCRESIENLEHIIATLNSVAHDCRISKIVGSSVGIVGTVLFITGFALAPFSFGASTPLMIAGGVIGGVGGGVAGGTGITEIIIIKEASKKTEELMETVKRLYRVLIDKMVIFQIKSSLSSMLPGALAGSFQFLGNTGLGIVKWIQMAGDSSSAAIQLSSSGFRMSTIVLHSVGAVLAVIGAVIDVTTIIMNANELSADQESEYAETIRKAITEIKRIERLSQDFLDPDSDLKSITF